jgi:hypothetical protein
VTSRRKSRPGIAARGTDTTTWTDQVDARPTLLSLAGLRDDYPVDGRVLTEITVPSALPSALRVNRAAVLRLGQVYKQILASDGQFADDTLAASTRAIGSGSARGAPASVPPRSATARGRRCARRRGPPRPRRRRTWPFSPVSG